MATETNSDSSGNRYTCEDKFPSKDSAKLLVSTPDMAELTKADFVSQPVDNIPDNGIAAELADSFQSNLKGSGETLHQHISTAKSLSVPLSGKRIRRRSAPSMLEPIQEGLLGISNIRRNSITEVQRAIDSRIHNNLPGGPCSNSDKLGFLIEPNSSSMLSRRRRSDPIGLLGNVSDRLQLFTQEARYPSPRRNSLVSATLDEISSQFELLDRKKQVVEETEGLEKLTLENDIKNLPPILITDS